MSFVTIIATAQAKPGKEAAARALVEGLLAPTHAEKGCVKYALHARLDKPGYFYFVEQWENQAAVDQHLQSAHIAAVMAKQAEILVSLDVAIVQPVPGGNPLKATL